jgi:hypothetical protein
MGKLPAIFIGALILWVAWEVFEYGPEQAFGGLFSLLSQPQYGEADRPTRSGTLADQILKNAEDGPAPQSPAEP